MSSEVEISLDTSGLRAGRRFLDSPPNDKINEARRCFFTALTVCHDAAARSAAMNMAIDEALLECATTSVIRFYGWQSPALSFGYFGRFADVTGYAGKRDLVRRWTGGGIVFHGEDLTYSIIIPASDVALTESTISIYEKIHGALCNALAEIGQRAVVVGVADPGLCNAMIRTARARVSDAGYSCFSTPVRADLMIDGRKVAGASQRRTRRGLLQQGSIQGLNVGNGLAERFAEALSSNCVERQLNHEILNRARKLAERKYETDAWLRKR